MALLEVGSDGMKKMAAMALKILGVNDENEVRCSSSSQVQHSWVLHVRGLAFLCWV